MPPKKGIVKSGNAGNSSKSSSSQANTPNSEKETSLFPPGSKFPLSLLNERCQKNGWDKPKVVTVSTMIFLRLLIQKHRDGGFSFAVTLSRVNKKTSQTDSVYLEPHPPYVRPTELEARHWGATYALYRFCNNIQLNRVLPPAPRDYWNELAAEHKAAPEHQQWMYDTDPFAARKQVDERQAKAVQKREAGASSGLQNAAGPNEFSRAPEVKMASSLRDLVEDAVKRATSFSTGDETLPILADDEVSQISKQLTTLGFKPAQIKNAVNYLCRPSSLGANLLSNLTHLEACIEYLVLHVPECDLPERFLPSNNSSNPFVTSLHSSGDDLKRRWMENQVIKEAGWPSHAVRECTQHNPLVQNVELLVTMLDRKLIGDRATYTIPQIDVLDKLRENPEELEALGAHYLDSSHIVMPLFSAPIQLHILLPQDPSHSLNGYPPVYMTSTSVSPYVRLHLLAELLGAMNEEPFLEPGEGFLMAAMRVLEETWANVETNGPPEMSEVLKHLVPTPSIMDKPPLVESTKQIRAHHSSSHQDSRRSVRGRDGRTDSQIRTDFEALCKSPKYSELFVARQRLPAFAVKDRFLTELQKSRVMVVVGDTGCGKTTQLPQFILDSLIMSNRGSKASIIVTQPRRLAAISVATRVSAERLDDGCVGYATRGESKQSKKTKLLFCTTGVTLRRLSSGDKLEDVTHVIVDEVHERSVDGDFLLLELKELLLTHPSLKVILMSATINHEAFVKYFNNAPMLTIPGFAHPVTDLYLEDYIPLLPYRPRTSKGYKQDSKDTETLSNLKTRGLGDQDISTIRSITHADRIDYELIASLINHIMSSAKVKGGILVFLSGVQEIRQCIEAVRKSVNNGEADVFPLHANLSNDEQRAVFKPTSKWKVIAATNVAEASITIDDVVYVIDSGKAKETMYDAESSLWKLEEIWISRAAAKQRRGRAGRTQPGKYYALYTKKQQEKMASYQVPEILRVPLETISLKVKVTRENEDIKFFLSRAIDPPPVAAMEKAWSVLKELGAVDEADRLTALGRHISVLPMDLRLAKMLILGTIFQCLDPILTVVAALSSKSLFFSPMDDREQAEKAKLKFNTHNSDFITDVNAYNECMRLRSEGKSQNSMKLFCEENYISPTTIREISTLRLDFFSSLCDLGFVPLSSNAKSPDLNSNSTNTNVIKAIILGGLWPRVARVELPKSAIKFDKVQAGTVQRENTAKEYRVYDSRDGRVFLHPSSVLFGTTAWKSPFIAYFQKQRTSKVFLRGASEVPVYALLLFGGAFSVDHIKGGLSVNSDGSRINLKAWPRIGILVNQLRRLLDAKLQQCIDQGTVLRVGQDDDVMKAMIALLTGDGLG
ncbi:hypothetical protein SERLA73DRAFT_120997 [Serpula lacrymans var. lacrymans S7.3]|uniref:RNA helicase n=2 Tax=Serpula lacrymans var. lacrymans TaxID=341189 RepID=F8PRB6_SERL3|nr:uncharacterized protein SERLADRAFT_367686 [Serpula lacrymans var. lacrymans S7.9]EGO02407.1 hypothetical protein SERLA73DRAFT_120997 [Serpula lacrymans var. lacrymans S7.3]EGO28133.1 hypothetical protein SERLADRAFT_367686 [Serpula lacrymans var. lacrymans S7.9]